MLVVVYSTQNCHWIWVTWFLSLFHTFEWLHGVLHRIIIPQCHRHDQCDSFHWARTHTHARATKPPASRHPWLNNWTIKTDSLTIWSDILSERMNCMHACIRNAPALYPSSFLYNYLSTPLHCSVGIPSGWCECNVCKLDIMFVCNFIVNVDNTNVPYIVSVHYSENGILIRARALSYAPTHTLQYGLWV